MGHFVSGADGGVPADLRSTYASNGQDHVFKYVDSGVIKSGSDEMAALVAQLRTIDPARMTKLHLSTTAGAKSKSLPPSKIMVARRAVETQHLRCCCSTVVDS